MADLYTKIKELEERIESMRNEIVKEKKVEEPTIQTQENRAVKLEDISNNLRYSSTVPTHSPRRFIEQIIPYFSGTTYRLYWNIGNAWKTIYDSAGSGLSSKARAYRGTSVQSIDTETDTKVQLNAESYDVGSEFDSSTNYRFTATTAGYYQVNGCVSYASPVDQKSYICQIKKNDSAYATGQFSASGTTRIRIPVSDIIYLAATDYIELWTSHNSGLSKNIDYGASMTFFSIHKLS
jgi:hypothetical protein